MLEPELAAALGAQRFLNEIQVTANLQHPHILPLYDSGSADGALFYVMPLVRGESLRDRLAREKLLPVDETIRITRQVAGALDFAHRQGIIHRDIKPENILLQEGEALLADFGIALAATEAGGGRLTGTGVSIGTVQYMSPEQAGGEHDLDARSDIYALAAVTYEMLAGEPPVIGRTPAAIIAKLLTERPTPLRVLRDVVPRSLDAAVMRALARGGLIGSRACATSLMHLRLRRCRRHLTSGRKRSPCYRPCATPMASRSSCSVSSASLSPTCSHGTPSPGDPPPLAPTSLP